MVKTEALKKFVKFSHFIEYNQDSKIRDLNTYAGNELKKVCDKIFKLLQNEDYKKSQDLNSSKTWVEKTPQKKKRDYKKAQILFIEILCSKLPEEVRKLAEEAGKAVWSIKPE